MFFVKFKLRWSKKNFLLKTLHKWWIFIIRKMLNVFPIPPWYKNIRLNLNHLIKSLDIVRLRVWFYAPHIVSEITVYHHDLFLYYEREVLDGNSLMEDRTATFWKQSIAIAVPVVLQERASLPSESPCVALVAFRSISSPICTTQHAAAK